MAKARSAIKINRMAASLLLRTTIQYTLEVIELQLVLTRLAGEARGNLAMRCCAGASTRTGFAVTLPSNNIAESRLS